MKYYIVKGEKEWQLFEVRDERILAFERRYYDRIIVFGESLQGVMAKFDELPMIFIREGQKPGRIS